MITRTPIWRCIVGGLLSALCVVSITEGQESAVKQDTVQQGRELTDKADTLFKEGKYREAIPFAKQGVAIREKSLGANHPDTAVSLIVLAKAYNAAAEYALAKSAATDALSIREKAFGSIHLETAGALQELANIYRSMSEYKKAEQLYRRALAIRETQLGPEHVETARTLHSLGFLFTDTGDYRQAQSFLQRALAIREKTLGPEHRETTSTLNVLGGLNFNIGAYRESERYWKRTLAIREKVWGAEHPETATTIHNLASVYAQIGEYTKAEALYLRALSIREKALGPDHHYVAGSLGGLASTYRETGADNLAEPLYRRAVEILEKALGPDHPDTALALIDIASLYADAGDLEKARSNYERALAIQEKVLGTDHPVIATTITSLASIDVMNGQYAEAERRYQRAQTIAEKSLGPMHRQTADTYRNLGELYRITGAYSKSEPLYQRALKTDELAFGFAHPDTMKVLVGLGTLYWARGEHSKALAALRRAQTQEAKNTDRFLLSGPEARKHSYLQSLTSDTYRFVSFSLSARDQESIALGLTSVLQRKGRVLDAMSGSVDRLRQNFAVEDQDLFDQFADVANQLSVLTFQTATDLPPEKYRERVNELVVRQEKLEGELGKLSSEFRHEMAPITIAEIRHTIPENAALIEWFRYLPFDPKALRTNAHGEREPKPARYIAYILKRDENPIAVDMGDALTIESLIGEFRASLSASTSNDGNLISGALTQKLIKPLLSHLKGTNQLLLSPDGAINLIPVSALLDENGEYLVHRFEITYLTSGRDLLRTIQKFEELNDPVVVADPNFGNFSAVQVRPLPTIQRSADLDRGGLVFRPLLNTRIEAQELRKVLNLKESSLFLKDNATEANLKRLHRPRILHVATHGFFLSDQELALEFRKRSGLTLSAEIGENPLLRSGLALSGANTRYSGENDDGILTALEAAQLDLYGTELVVLSACDSGVGDVQNGEGVYGLRRALILAGAQSQLTSLWKVPDEATRMLMVDYYQRLLKGEGRSAALRHAQQTMLASKESSHPYFWASFVPIGNWTPLTTFN